MTILFMQFSFTLIISILLCLPSFSIVHKVNNKTNPSKQHVFTRGVLSLPSGEKIYVNILYSEKDQQKGLSGIKENKFKSNQGALFFYAKNGLRQFWMPDTYFNLDIIFLDKNFNILEVAKDMPAHPGTKNPSQIAKTALIWSSSYPISEIESNIHLLQ